MSTPTQVQPVFDLRAGPLVSAAIGMGFGVRGFGLPATIVFVLAAETAYAVMAATKPEWIGRPKYKPIDFALDVGSALVGWGVVTGVKNGAQTLSR